MSRWCNTRQTEDRFWVSIATWRRHQCVWQRSACTLCPASPSTTRMVAARLAARPKPQVGTAMSYPSYVCLLDSPVSMLPGQNLSVISAFNLEPAIPAQASLSSLLPHGFYFLSEDRINSINSRPTYAILFSYGCNVDVRVEQMYGLLPYTVLILDEEGGRLSPARTPCLHAAMLIWMLLRRLLKRNRWAHAPSIKLVSLWGKRRCLSFSSLQWSLITSIPSRNIEQDVSQEKGSIN